MILAIALLCLCAFGYGYMNLSATADTAGDEDDSWLGRLTGSIAMATAFAIVFWVGGFYLLQRVGFWRVLGEYMGILGKALSDFFSAVLKIVTLGVL